MFFIVAAVALFNHIKLTDRGKLWLWAVVIWQGLGQGSKVPVIRELYLLVRESLFFPQKDLQRTSSLSLYVKDSKSKPLHF